MHNIHCTFFLHDRQFAKVAESIIVKQNGMDKDTSLARHFPDFIWLLRDVRLAITVNGENVKIKDYIKTTVFGCANEHPVGRAIMTIFPSFDAVEIRPPNDSDLSDNNVSCQETLTSTFHKQVEDFVHHLREIVKPKQGFDGPLLAEMADKYVAVVNDPDATPCISDMCMEGIANSKIKQLAKEYDREMSAAIRMPIESTTLIGAHNRILAMKKTALIKEVQCYLSSSRLEQTIKELEDKIATFEGSDSKKIVGGILKKYTDQNYEISKECCKSVFDKLYKCIKEKTDRDQYGEYTMEMMSHDLQDLEIKYYKSVVGPAQWDVYEEKKEYIQSKKEAYRNILDRKKQECEVKRRKKIDQLVEEYDHEFGAAISKLGMPMEESCKQDEDVENPTTLLGVHHQILKMKKTALINEVCRYLTSSGLDQTIKELEDKIAMFEGSDPKQIVGGILKKYTDQNYEISKEYCKSVFDKLYKHIKDKTDRDQYGEYTMEMMSHDLQDLEKEYYKSVEGPAQWDVYEEKKEYIQSKKEAYRNILDRKKQECEVKRRKKIDQLVEEYDHEVGAAISKLGMPMEESCKQDEDVENPTTLLGVHHQILKMKKTALINEVCRYLTSSGLDQTIKELEDKIAMFEGSDPKQIVGGILKKYTDQNYEISKEYCKSVFDKLYKHIKDKTDRDQYGEYTMEMMSHDLQDLEKEYYKSVVGPAQWDVYEEKKEYIQSKKEAYRNILDRKKQECEVKRMKKIDQLVEEYDHEVGAAISKLGMPMEESCKQDEDVENPTTLLGVHHQILKMKKTALINEVRRYLTSSCLDQTIKDLENKIATFEGSNPKKIVGGILKNYADQNYKKSVQYCRTVFDSEEMYKPIKKKVEDDLQLGHYTTEEMSKDLEDLKKRYRKRIVGPAREDVYNEKQKFIMEEIEKKKQHMAKGECYISEADSVLVIPGCGLNIRKNIPEIVERMVL